MKKTLSLLLLIITGIIVNAQTFYNAEINWKKPEKIKIDSSHYIKRLSFENAIYSDISSIPEFSDKLKFQNKQIKSYNLKNVQTENLTNEEIEIIKNNNNKISEEFNVSFKTSTIRKNKYIYLNILPVRKNSETGDYEKLLNFTLLLETENINTLKSKENKYPDNSAMSQGSWYKFRIKESGIYELSYSLIQSLGFNDPSQTGIFGYGGMVPKKNSEPRYMDLPERPAYHQDNNNNGNFDNGDALIVYLEGPNKHKVNPANKYEHEIHNYSDYSYYFLSDNAEALRVNSVASSKETATHTANSYDYNITLEKDSINVMASGRTFYWKKFDYFTEYDFSFNIPYPVSSESTKIITRLGARSSQSSRFKITLNGSSHYTGLISLVSGSYSGPYGYSIKDEFSVSDINSSNNINVKYEKPTSSAEGWLDYITIKSRAQLKVSGNQLRFRDMKTAGTGNITEFTINNAGNSYMILDITDPVNSFEILPTVNNSSLIKFKTPTDSLREFIAFDKQGSYPAPQTDGSSKLGFVSNQNLHALSGIDYVIVTNSLFSEYAEELAAFHQSYNNLTTAVIDQEDIFNEFSSGTPDVVATRDFMKMLYDKADNEENMPEYLLLFGDGSYDNRTTGSPNTNFILTYQSVNELRPTSSFVSDDFYGLLDEGEGSVAGFEGLDIGIGRFPVKSKSEAEDVLNKIYSYVDKNSFGSWRNDVCFIGDDAEDIISHMTQASTMGDNVMNRDPVYNVDKILLDAYQQISTAQGDRYPDVNDEIDERVEKGALLINYTGHGNQKTLAHEAVVTLSQINSWNNMNNLPVFVTATCEFSRFDDYEFTSAGEQILLNPEGGGIALFTTTRLVFSGANYNLNKEFYRHVFERDEDGNSFKLGEIIRKTKNGIGSDSNKRNFSLLGDPALTIAIPEYIVKTDSINGENISVYEDTVGAASKIVVEGHIEDRSGNIMTNYNGTLYPEVFDKVMEYTTLSNDGSRAVKFKEQKNILYSGKASIDNGYFKFEFIIPVDIAYYADYGKISYYAKSDYKDAHGYYDEITIGGSADVDITDNMGPEIELYMNTTDFIDGGITDENPDMLAFVRDESGINTVGNGIGHDIMAVLDNNSMDAVVLNDFYEADLDSYTSGKIRYPFSNLETGPHSLRLKVWDIFNNSAEAEISFIVANSSELVIEQLGNFPNPFHDQTCFRFTHNHANEELDLNIKIYTMNGRLVKSLEQKVYSDGYTLTPICWNGSNNRGEKVESGVYIYNLRLKSPNGDIVNKSEKLVFVK